METTSYRVLHDLPPVAHQQQPEGGREHDDEEGPVELAGQRPGHRVEAEHGDHDHVGDHVGQHLEPEQRVHLLADVVQVAVDAAQDVQLDHHGRLLVPGDLGLVPLLRGLYLLLRSCIVLFVVTFISSAGGTASLVMSILTGSLS